MPKDTAFQPLRKHFLDLGIFKAFEELQWAQYNAMRYVWKSFSSQFTQSSNFSVGMKFLIIMSSVVWSWKIQEIFFEGSSPFKSQ